MLSNMWTSDKVLQVKFRGLDWKDCQEKKMFFFEERLS